MEHLSSDDQEGSANRLPFSLKDLMARLGASAPDKEQDLLELWQRIAGSAPSSSSSEEEDILESADLEGLAKYVKDNNPRNIICMVGAGLSTAAGIPDFRTPGTGLYDNLQRYNLPEPQAVFDLDFFQQSPNAFYDLAKELWPTGKTYRPTTSHYFLRMLEQQGRLLRCYTQNIDMLEQLAGLSEDKVIAAHGNFAKAHALNGREVDSKELEAAVFQGIDACRELATKYGALVKPDIVFFGESLPLRFQKSVPQDFSCCDLLIVLGTSLAVAPFNQLIAKVKPSCPRVLINREAVGLARPCSSQSLSSLPIKHGFRFGSTSKRDMFLQGDCNEKVRQLCARLGWTQALASASGAPKEACEDGASMLARRASAAKQTILDIVTPDSPACIRPSHENRFQRPPQMPTPRHPQQRCMTRSRSQRRVDILRCKSGHTSRFAEVAADIASTFPRESLWCSRYVKIAAELVLDKPNRHSHRSEDQSAKRRRHHDREHRHIEDQTVRQHSRSS